MKKKLPLGIKFFKYLFLSLGILILHPFYWIVGLLPRDKNLWIFSAWGGELYNCNPRMLFEYVNEHHPEINTVWIARNKSIIDNIKQRGFNGCHANSFKAFLYSIRAGKMFVATGNEMNLFFVNGIDYYNIWHGMPLKKVGHDVFGYNRSFISGKLAAIFCERFFCWKAYQGLLGRKKFFTIVNSDFWVPILQSAFKLPVERVLKTGSPRCDALFFNRKEPFLENLKKKFLDSKIILYMPTFRTAMSDGKPFDPFLKEYGFDAEEMESALERNKCVFIYKAHFQDLRLMELKQSSSRFISISDADYDELYNFVGQVDVLVSDYSSIYFDFIATKKPVILCPFDYEDYIKYSRDIYFDYFENIEGVKAQNWHEFIRILDDKSYYPVTEATRKKFAEYLDGNCCQKVFDAVIMRDREK